MTRIVLFMLAVGLAAQDKPVVTPPTIIRKVQAQYSEKARKNKIEGLVVLNIIVAADGHAMKPSVRKSLDPELDQNAIAAVKEWLFKPGSKNGQPVAMYADIEIRFRLADSP